MAYTPIAGQIWPQGQPRQGQKNRFFRLLPSGEYTLEGYQQPFSSDAVITDPDFDKVTLLLDMEGTAGSASFVDRSNAANTITAVSGAVISNARAKFGSGSFSNNNQGRYLEIGGTINLSFTGDFTIEVWFWAEASQPAYPTVFEIGQYTNGILFRPYHSGGGLWINGSNYGDFLDETLIPKQQWNHAAFVRSGTSFVCYLNGQVDKTATISGTINITGGLSRIGSSTHSSGQHLNGYIDEVRVTNGLARYLAPFTPPTEPFPLQGEPTPEPETPVFSVSAITYTQSSIYSGTTAVSNQVMTDGSFTNTGVATNSGSGQFVRMDLGGVFSIDRVVIGTATSSIPGGWSKSYTENRTIQHSIDGTAWTNTFNTGTFGADGIYTFNVNIEARYIRIIDTNNSWIAISEFYALIPEPENPVVSLQPLFWYDFADESSVSLSGSNIASIQDKGSQGYDLTPRATSGPTYGNGINGLKCVNFGSPGHIEYLRNTSTANYTIGEVYIVLSCNNTFDTTFPNFNGLIGSALNEGWRVYGSGNSLIVNGLNQIFPNNSSTSGVGLPAVNNPIVLRLKKSDDTGFSSNGGFILGNETQNSSLGRGWGGFIGEVVCFTNPLSSQDREAVLGYLYEKWAITP